MKLSFNDTIAAPATAPGKSAIAVLRMSGALSKQIIQRIFETSIAVSEIPSAQMTFGHIVSSNKNQIIDNVLVTIFRQPHSFTGEDTVEISCHGGPLVVREILNLLLENGARLAMPGEYTQRAFLNGKIDLLQAESIADIIDSQSRHSLQQSQLQMSGRLSAKLMELKKKLKRQLALLEVELDFSEEDIEFAPRDELLANVDSLLVQVEELLESFTYGKVLREGAHLALVGRPNVGKSSILNRLLEEDRAIVSDVPGTTRDVIEESFDIDGMLFKVSDTAGLRFTKDGVEKQGVKRTRDVLSRADVIMFIIESGTALTREDEEALQIVNDSAHDAKKYLVVNKIDLQPNRIDLYTAESFSEKCEISAMTGEGFTELKEKLANQFLSRALDSDYAFINKSRHRDALRRTANYLDHASASLKSQLSPEFVSLDIRSALDAMGEITGEVTTDDILNDIFSTFCIGK